MSETEKEKYIKVQSYMSDSLFQKVMRKAKRVGADHISTALRLAAAAWVENEPEEEGK